MEKIAYLLITVEHGKLKIVGKALAKFQEVQELAEVYGRYDILAKVVVTNDDELQSFYQNKLSVISGIVKTETLVAMAEEVSEHSKENEENENVSYEI